MLAPITNILPQAVVERLRILPRAGHVRVRQGQNVRATDVIATAEVNPSHIMLDVASALGVSRAKAADHIERYEGESVAGGDVVAQTKGLFSRVVRSPVDGKIVLMTDGYVFIEEKSTPFELLAGIPGEVKELVHEMGAVIETTGALIQGAWGNGRIGSGILNALSKSPGDVLLPEQVEGGPRDAVLMSGRCSDAEVFRRAAAQQIKGLILGSIQSELIPVVRKLPFPVLLTDGFGDLPMSTAAFRLMSTSHKREVAVNAEPFDPDTGSRPEVLIPLPTAPDVGPAPVIGRLEKGQRIRVTRSPRKGTLGIIDSIPPGRMMFPNGLRLQAVRIKLESGEIMLVPLANVEIVNVRS